MKTEKEKEMKVKYKTKDRKVITIESIIIKGACVKAIDKVVLKFGGSYGLYQEIPWNEENEEWVKDNISDGIEWLIKEGFIEEIKKKKEVIFDGNKVYIYVSPYRDNVEYKLHKGYSNNEWFWIALDTSIYLANGKRYTPKEALDSVLSGEGKVYISDSIKDFYSGDYKEI